MAASGKKIAHTEKTSIQVKVLPRSSRNEIIRISKGSYRIKLTAPPVEGKANKALLEFLSKKTGLSKRDIEIVSGAHSKNKVVRLNSLSAFERLEQT